MALIKGGTYIPLYGSDSMPVKVDDFSIDVYPVTNAEYITFLKENPKWKKSNVIALYADGAYLRHFKDELTLKDGENPNAPMTNVSWFAAKKYCECQGKRLPTLDEWEYVGMSDQKNADARSKDDYNKFILSWYEKPSTYHQEIGSTFENYWGVYDMHGLVWEWTQDFNSVLISGESRSDKDGNQDLFCGGAALGSTDLMNYAAFMRYAFRGSVKANYSVRTLGFRCAKSLK
ncbi:MAG TPA: formylglycine-generating enzyme family protein [Brumimicrobium sp.]|nr:formylglycine-generating enzyme family protein [Brumimicrobium sp.]